LKINALFCDSLQGNEKQPPPLDSDVK